MDDDSTDLLILWTAVPLGLLLGLLEIVLAH
jgi:hypothetical protein